MFAFKGLNYGIDFTGGTLIQINAGKFISVEEVREIVGQYDDEANILHGGENFLVLRLRICWSALPNIKESVRKYALRRSI